MVKGKEEYEVKEILDSRFRWGKLWYLIKFVGWSHSNNMWLPHTEVHTPAIVEEYTLHKLAQPRHSCHQTKLRSMSNFPGLCPYVLGHHLFVFFSICCICLMHFH